MSFPSHKDTKICFAHSAYQLKSTFDQVVPDIDTFEVRTPELFEERIDEANVFVVSGFWRNSLLKRAKHLKFIQSISAGINQYNLDELKRSDVRLASGKGANRNAVANHAMSLILALARRLPEARDNQSRRVWRPMQSDLSLREDELTGKTILIVGLGLIGGRLAQLAKAFGMNVVGIRRDIKAEPGHADEVRTLFELNEQLPHADFVVLTCALNEETKHIINEKALSKFKDGAYLINVARGECVEQNALIEALKSEKIVGAALDCVEQEPLPESSELWSLPNVLITSHVGGETRKIEQNIVDILAKNLALLYQGNGELINQVI